ncbi:MAG TPA: DNA recombination protein RmuC [Rickettsiales bacterium]|nr:DNA recombination protein RmuC [Rickettsiales bacterium]
MKFKRSLIELQKERFNNTHLQEKIINFESEIAAQNKKIDSYIVYNNDLQNLKGKFEGSFNQLREENIALKQERSVFLDKISDFEKKNERFTQMQKEKENWEKNQDIRLLQLSEELMKKNHEQQEKLTKSSQEQVAQITQNLMKDFEKVLGRVENIDEEMKKSSGLVGSLLTPGGAGRTAEITLENILKSSGLKEKQTLFSVGDYILQSHFSTTQTGENAEGKRPDAILFLPDNRIIIIDSKSSPHFLELENAKKTADLAQEKIILGKIKDSMRRHFEALKKRDYEKFFAQEMHLNDISDYKILNAMFLQTEQMLNIIDKIDHDFVSKAMNERVFILSPITLINLLNSAKFIVDRVKQQENIAELKREVEKLINNIALVIKESKDVGKALNKGLSSYNKMTKRFNQSIFKSVKNIEDLGIVAKKSDEIKMLEDYGIEEEMAEG